MKTTLELLDSNPKTEPIEKAPCIRCGVCLRICSHNLSPVLIKEAFEKGKIEKIKQFKAELCVGCGNCNYVYPTRIDLKGSVLRAKAAVHKN